MNTIRFTTFIAALEGRRKFWRDFDRRQTREHQAAEMEWLRQARAKLRELVKADYATLKDQAMNYLPFGRTPNCPALREPRFTVDTKGTWSEAHSLLTWDPDAKTSVC